MTNAFASMALPSFLLESLEKLQFNTPTPIQERAVPAALEGRDVLGSAQTGTGKTAAFLLPLLTHLSKEGHEDRIALVVTPTRELAQQVLSQVHLLLKSWSSPLPWALLIGGDSMFKQERQLASKPRLIIGTPGRLNDHLRNNRLRLDRCDFLVLDETDRMLDMGFRVQLETIVEQLAEKRQTLLFSATLPSDTQRVIAEYLTDPVRIVVDQVNAPSERIAQSNRELHENDKYDTLVAELEKRQGSVIVFMKAKYATERMVRRLNKEGHPSDAIHGDLRQSRRTKVLTQFRQSKFRVLVATDVAARGLDIPHIEHVINYDLPQSPEDYIHRIGRTARAGAQGEAVNFISSADQKYWRAICALMDPSSASAGKPEGRGRKRSGGKHPARSGQRGGSNQQRPGRYADASSRRDGGQSSFSRGASDGRRASFSKGGNGEEGRRSSFSRGANGFKDGNQTSFSRQERVGKDGNRASGRSHQSSDFGKRRFDRQGDRQRSQDQQRFSRHGQANGNFASKARYDDRGAEQIGNVAVTYKPKPMQAPTQDRDQGGQRFRGGDRGGYGRATEGRGSNERGSDRGSFAKGGRGFNERGASRGSFEKSGRGSFERGAGRGANERGAGRGSFEKSGRGFNERGANRKSHQGQPRHDAQSELTSFMQSKHRGAKPRPMASKNRAKQPVPHLVDAD
jgi:ATP-dependent RNA helicase DeaD